MDSSNHKVMLRGVSGGLAHQDILIEKLDVVYGNLVVLAASGSQSEH